MIKINSGENTTSLISGAEKTGLLHAKEANWATFSRHKKKITSKWIKDLNKRPQTIKFLKENISRLFFDISHSNIVLDLSPQAREMKTKISKWDYIKLKSFCTVKEMVNKIKRQLTEREKIFAKDMSDKGNIQNKLKTHTIQYKKV